MRLISNRIEAEKISELEGIAVETKMKNREKKDRQKNDHSIIELWDNFKQLRYM